jgi:hypothetical protein
MYFSTPADPMDANHEDSELEITVPALRRLKIPAG